MTVFKYLKDFLIGENPDLLYVTLDGRTKMKK